MMDGTYVIMDRCEDMVMWQAPEANSSKLHMAGTPS